MKKNSPLRYPGGKATLASLLGNIIKLNDLRGRAIAEPFAGGAGASIDLLYREEVPEIRINDADPAIHALWSSLIRDNDSFLSMLRSTRINMAEWRRQRDVYRSKRQVSRLRRGFAAFYLNRTNRSGIIMDGGPIGGIRQKGPWKLNARFNKTELAARCRRLKEYGERIKASGDDGIEFIRKVDADKTLFFIDPPYFVKGPQLYLNGLDHNYHRALATQLKSQKDDAWVLTYDDCPELHDLYAGWATVRPFRLRYAAAARRDGSELLITPKWMKLPKHQDSVAVSW